MKINPLLRKQIFCKKYFTKILSVLFLLITNQTFAQISGVIFRDFDQNGKRTLINPIEVGAMGITIRAYVGSNAAISATSAADGTYQFSAAQIPAGSNVRLEFDNFGKGYFDSFFGNDNKSNVQFVTAPQTNVNLGINYPSDFCGSTIPFLVLPCFVNGDPLGGGSAGESATLLKVPYEAEGSMGDPNYPTKVVLATAKQVGSIWSAIYQRSTFTLLTAAFVKRHAGLGPLGIGGIYKTDLLTDITSNFVDLTTLGINLGTDTHVGLSPDMLLPSHDSLTMDAVGKIGIGGMAMSQNEEKIYVINNYDRKIYSIKIGVPIQVPTAADIQSYAIPNPSCPNNDYRAGAISQYHGKIYVGVVCTAETSQDTTELKGTIYEFSETTGVFTDILHFPLNFKRGSADYTQSCINYNSWRAWTNKFPPPCAVAGAYADGIKYFAMYPQPMITSLAFDDEGSMLIGFTDRYGHQAGRGNWSPTSSDEKRYFDGFQGGDALRAYNNNGIFELENNGKAGPLTGCGPNIGQGPGGGQFYCDSKWKYFGNVAHDAVAGGVLTILPGTGEVLATSFDPIDEVIQAGGFRVWDTKTGVRRRAFVLYQQQPGSFGKAAGLGNIVVGCNASPLEIGNRVWSDINDNGIQDPDEVGIDGVVLALHDLENGGIEVGKDTTAESGQFYFNDKNVAGGLKYKHKYEIRIDILQNSLKNNQYYKFSPKGAASGLNSEPNKSKNFKTEAVSNDSLRDSDAQLVGNFGTVRLITGNIGETSHTFDVGLVKCIKPDAGKDLAICPPISGTDFIDAPANQKWTFLSGPATATIDSLTGIIKNMTAAGDYLYVLTLTPAGETCSDTVKITRKIQPDAGIDKIGIDGFCSPISTAKLTGSPIGGVWSVLPTNSPLAQIDNLGNVAGMSKIGIYGFIYTVNGCADTVKIEIKDCGIGSIGDFVWYDKKKNGLQDNTSIGAYNIAVELYKLDNLGNLPALPLMTTKTDVFGKYLFKNLVSGDYKVKFVSTTLPINYLLDDKQAIGSDRIIDSDASPLTGLTNKITIDVTNPILRDRRDIDAGIVQTPTCPACWSILISTIKLKAGK
jgi:hypothetical protein